MDKDATSGGSTQTNADSFPLFNVDDFEPLEVPVDEEGYVLACALDDDEAIASFFDKFGFVVIGNVLSDEEVDATLGEFFTKAGIDPADPMGACAFFDRQRFGHLGIMGSMSDIRSPTQLANRQNPRVHRAFASVLGTPKLWVDHDRLGVLRPTVNIKGKDGDVHDEMEEWRTRSRWLHLDCNPHAGFASIGSFSDDNTPIDFSSTLIIQSLLTLTDARAVDGGFHCVPGFHKHTMDVFPESGPMISSNCIQIQDERIHGHIQKIAIRRGCLLAWTSLLPHGNHPNFSERWRAVQYLRMMPTSGTPYSPFLEGPVMREQLEEAGVAVSELGERLFGLTSWDEEEEEEAAGSSCALA